MDGTAEIPDGIRNKKNPCYIGISRHTKGYDWERGVRSPKKALNASLCAADLIGLDFKTYRVADKPLPKPSVEGKSSPRYDKENKYDFIIVFIIKAELK